MQTLDTRPASASTGDDESGASGSTRLDRWWLLGGAVAVTIVRWLFGIERTMFQVYADEPANLAMARWFGGGTTWNLFDYGTRRPGLSLLMAPGFAVTDDASIVYRATLLLNSVLAGVSTVVLVFVLRRLTTWRMSTAVIVAVCVALAPMSVAASSTAWAEPLTTLTFLMTLLALMRFAEAPGAGRAALATGAAAAGFLAHSRLVPLVVVAVLVTVATLLRRRDLVGAAAVAVWTVAATASVVLVSGAAIDHVWTAPTDTNDAAEVAKRLDSPLAIADAAIGQLWYLLAATFGLVALGAVELGGLATRREPSQRRTGAWIVIAATLPLLAVSALFMSSRPRADHLVYGRYNDAVLWPIVALGVAWIGGHMWNARRARSHTTIVTIAAIVAALLASAAAVDTWHADELASRITLTHMVPGIVWLSPERGSIDVWPTTLAALAVMAIGLGAVLLRRRVPWLVPAVVVIVLVAGGGRARVEFGDDANALSIAEVVRETNDLLPDGERVGYSLARPSPEITLDNQRAWAQAYQFHLPEHEFVLDEGPDDDVGPFVFAPFDDVVMIEIGADEIWADPRSGISLWREPQP